MFFILLSVGIMIWALYLYFRPQRLTPNKFLYRWIYNRFYCWKGCDTPYLSIKQIKGYALSVILLSISLFFLSLSMFLDERSLLNPIILDQLLGTAFISTGIAMISGVFIIWRTGGSWFSTILMTIAGLMPLILGISMLVA